MTPRLLFDYKGIYRLKSLGERFIVILDKV